MCVTPNPHAKELGIATVGDSDRLNTFEVTRTFWDSNGTLFVTIKDTAAQALEVDDLHDRDIERARSLARRCLMYPEKTRSAALSRSTYLGNSLQLTFAVSRNG